MEKIAILSDIHGNITALEAVLDDIKKRNINRIFCLGDYIMKCSHPDLVIDKLKKCSEIMLLGNCDYVLCKDTPPNSNLWYRNKVGEERINFLRDLPVSHEFYMSGHLIRLFHASPHNLNDIYNPMFSNKNNNYSHFEITNPERLFENTDFINKTQNDPIPDIVIYGHIHTPFSVRYKNKTILNTGSVGNPIEMQNKDINDKDNKFSTMASYIILEGNYASLELDSISFNIVRVPYNIEKEINDLKLSDFPDKEIVIRALISAMPTNI